MDLVAGDLREILLAITLGNLDTLDDPDRFEAHLPLGGGLDPGWLDAFSGAARAVLGSAEPVAFSAACWQLEGRAASIGDRTIERVDPGWIGAVAAVPERHLGAVASRWLDLMAVTVGPLGAEDRAAFRELAGQLVDFARRATLASDVVFAWSP